MDCAVRGLPVYSLPSTAYRRSGLRGCLWGYQVSSSADRRFCGPRLLYCVTSENRELIQTRIMPTLRLWNITPKKSRRLQRRQSTLRGRYTLRHVVRNIRDHHPG